MVEMLDEALATRRELYGPRHLDVAESLSALASAYKEIGDLDRAGHLVQDRLIGAAMAELPLHLGVDALEEAFLVEALLLEEACGLGAAGEGQLPVLREGHDPPREVRQQQQAEQAGLDEFPLPPRGQGPAQHVDDVDHGRRRGDVRPGGARAAGRRCGADRGQAPSRVGLVLTGRGVLRDHQRLFDGEREMRKSQLLRDCGLLESATRMSSRQSVVHFLT